MEQDTTIKYVVPWESPHNMHYAKFLTVNALLGINIIQSATST